MENDIICITARIEIHPANNGYAVVRDGSVYGTYETVGQASEIADSLAEAEQE